MKKFKNGGSYVAVVMVLICVFSIWGISSALSAGYAAPGSEDDPLISAAYLEERIGLSIVELKPNQKILGEAGTELILRAGKANAIGSNLGGLSDVTAGMDIDTGSPVEKNHLLIIPRNDGRGLLAKSDVVLMVRGRYTLE
jgi:hypothetical protein